MVKIGDVDIRGPLALAPMAGVTDAPFRALCRAQGAALTCTEMVSAKALVYHDEKTKQLLWSPPDEHPAAVQIFGHEPEVMAEAAPMALAYSGADILDINMGCPVGKVIRSCRLDEIGQLLNVLGGSMSFVGTRPEVPKYVARYTPEMMATLLLPAGVTSEASIRYKDEAELLDKAEDVDETYVQQVLPGKMAYNLESIRHFGLGQELLTMLRTVKAVL